MALSDLDVKEQYNADGVTTTFAIPFTPIFDDSEETKVYVDDSLQTEGALQDYTLTGAPDDDSFHVNVEFNSAPANGTTVTVRRKLTLDQALDLISAGTVKLQTLETHLDGIVAKIQQVAEALERAPKLKNTTSLGDLALPDPSSDAVLGWNSAATALENKSSSSTADITGFDSEEISSGGTITAANSGMQYRPVSGSGGAVSASNTPFGSSGSWQTATMVILRGTDATNTVTLSHNDAQYGAILNGTMELGLYDVIALVYDGNAERWIELWRNN